MNKLKILFIISFCLSYPLVVSAATLKCADVVPGEGTAKCISECKDTYPVEYSAGDGGCVQAYNAGRASGKKCCGTLFSKCLQAANTDNNADAKCMNQCEGTYSIPVPAGDGGCSGTANKCCSKGEVAPSTTEDASTSQSTSDSQSLPSFSSLIKSKPTELIGNIIGGILGLTGTITVIMMIYGGLLWMTAGGNEQTFRKGKQIIAYTAVGLALIFSSYAILSFLFTSLR